MNLLILLAALAVTSAAILPEEFIPNDILNVPEGDDYVAINEGIFIEGRNTKGRSLSSFGKNKIKHFVSRMPEGFPELGLPVLAPFVKDEHIFKIKESFADINAKLEDLHIEGLDNVLINHFEVNYVFSQNINYNFTFPKIIATGKYLSDSTFDLIKEFGIDVRHYGEGDFEFVLENLTFEGYFKYTMPFVFGSISIYNFKGSVELESFQPTINGLAGESEFDELINDKFREFGVKYVNSNQELINKLVQDLLIPMANTKLDGKTIWSLIFG